MGYRGLAVMGERPGGAPGTRQRIRCNRPRHMSGVLSVGALTQHIFLNALDVEVDNRLLSFIAKKEIAAADAIHESILGKTACTGGVAEDIKCCFLIRVSVHVIEAHLMTGQVLQGGLAKIICENITSSLTRGSVAAPALRIVPFVTVPGSVHVDGNQADVALAQLQAKPVDSPAALIKGNVFVFRNQEFRIKTEGGKGGHNSAGDFAVVRPFKETAVRGSLSCSFLAVSVVNQDFHRTRF